MCNVKENINEEIHVHFHKVLAVPTYSFIWIRMSDLDQKEMRRIK